MKLKNLKGEIWRFVFINGERTTYQVSNKGRFKRDECLLNCCPIKNQYISCVINFEGKKYATRLHRLVAIAFKKNPKKLPQVNHKDGKKSNNASKNLEWCTSKHNIIHSFKLGLVTRKKGKESHLFDKGRKIIDNNTGTIYSSVAGASRALRIPRTTISAEIHGFRPNKYNLVLV